MTNADTKLIEPKDAGTILIETIDEDTIQKMCDNFVIDEDEYPYAIGYSPKFDIIVFYNYDENDIVGTCEGKEFLKDHKNLINEFLIRLEITPIGVLNKEEIEDYNKAYDEYGQNFKEELEEELNDKLEKAERFLKSANLEILSYFDLEQLEEDIKQSLERQQVKNIGMELNK